MARISATWLLMAGVYLLFAGSLSWTELVAGGVTATFTALFMHLLHRAGRRRLRLDASWPRIVGRTIASLCIDTPRVAIALARTFRPRPFASAGQVSRQPFQAGTAAPDAAGRRGLVTLATSLAPNGYVIGIEADAILLHRLVPTSPKPDREWPL